MKATLAILLGVPVASSCATRSTIPSRIRERPEVCSALTPAMRAEVDAGQITQGMTKDAVFMAWGKPSETVHGGWPGRPV